LPRSWVRAPLRAWYSSFVFVVCSVGSDLCDGLITRPEESCRLWYLSDCMWSRSFDNEATWARVGVLRHGEYHIFTTPSPHWSIVFVLLLTL
jgi:hypothetical protein